MAVAARARGCLLAVKSGGQAAPLLRPRRATSPARPPFAAAPVLDGAARLTAAIPPVAEALSATIRKHGVRLATLAGLVARGALSAPAAGVLRALVQASRLISCPAPPGARKTSMLAALLAAVPCGRCVRVCEEIRELGVPLPHGAAYETRPPSVDGTAGIDLRELVRFCPAETRVFWRPASDLGERRAHLLGPGCPCAARPRPQHVGARRSPEPSCSGGIPTRRCPTLDRGACPEYGDPRLFPTRERIEPRPATAEALNRNTLAGALTRHRDGNRFTAIAQDTTTYRLQGVPDYQERRRAPP